MADHDVSYFKRTLKTERTQLINQCSQWQKVLSEQSDEGTLPENVIGEIRTAIGLTELLLNQKLKQFGELVRDCEKKIGEIKITCTDLQGFWDMVYFEVEKVNNTFKKLEKMQKSNWEAEEEEDVEVPKKKMKLSKPKPTSQPKPNAATKAHILAARQRLAEAKAKAMKSKEIHPIASEKENFITVSIADSTTPDNNKKFSSPSVSKKANKEELKKIQIKGENMPTTKRVSRRSRTKEGPPLSCITRSAKRALTEQNKASV